MEDKLSIKLNIADRMYPLKIKRANEEKLRRAAKMINDDLALYRDYHVSDARDMLAISALNFVTRLIDAEESTTLSPALEQLITIDQYLANFLEQNDQTIDK